QSVRLIVQRHLGAGDTAHGLRAGFITEGARRGATAQALQQTSRHRSPARRTYPARDGICRDGSSAYGGLRASRLTGGGWSMSTNCHLTNLLSTTWQSTCPP